MITEENTFDLKFCLLADGSLFCKAAKLTDKVHFDGSIRFGSQFSLNDVLQKAASKEDPEYP